MRPYSVADSLLEIKALDSKYPAQVTLNATISFLSSPVLQSGTVNSAPLINNISEEVRFSIGILPELGLLDYVNNVLSTWGGSNFRGDSTGGQPRRCSDRYRANL